MPDDVGVLKFDFIRIRSSEKTSAREPVLSVHGRVRGGGSGPYRGGSVINVAGFDRPEGSSPASLEDTECIRSGVSSASSEADDLADDEPNTLLPITVSLTSQAGGLGLVSLDEVILEDVFSVRARLMVTVPKFLRGAHRAAVRVPLDGVLAGWEQNDTMLQIRSWKLFLLIPRMFLFRSSRGGLLLRKTIGPCVDVHAGGVGEARRIKFVHQHGCRQEEFQGTQKGPGHHREESTPSVAHGASGRQALEGAFARETTPR